MGARLHPNTHPQYPTSMADAATIDIEPFGSLLAITPETSRRYCRQHT